MKMVTTALAATAAAISTLALARDISPLPPPPPSGTGLPTGQCFRNHDIRNHTVVDNYTMLIDVDGRATYRITMSGACLAGSFSTDPIITRQPPGSTIICKPIDMDVSIAKAGFGFGFETPCIVDSIVQMTPEELAALPRRLKP